MDKQELIERYEQRKERREAKLRSFFDPAGKRKFLVMQRAGSRIYGRCNTIPEVVQGNLLQLEENLAVEWTDELPYMEPWLGTGIYANAFGCAYVYRDNDAPCVRYRYHSIEEVKHIEQPDWRKSPTMNMAIDTIDALKEATHARIPISLTDTQSAFDTATLVLDAAEFFTSCYVEEEAVMGFMKKINDLIIEFSREQMARIGQDILARPGHIMPSSTFGAGLSISDDNLAVSSPHINELVSLPFNQILGDEFGGVAIHSCGAWSSTMALLKKCRNILMVDCGLGPGSGDPNSNSPTAVRDALKGTGIIAKVRVGGSREDLRRTLAQVFHPDLKLVVEIGWEKEGEERNYRFATDTLEALYAAAVLPGGPS